MLWHSDLRQVPDNQEVFMYPGSGVSIIVEILQMVGAPQLEDAIRWRLFDNFMFLSSLLPQISLWFVGTR